MAGADLPQWCVSDQLRPSAGLGRSPAFLPHKPAREASGHRPSGRPQQLRQPKAPPRSWREGEAKDTLTQTCMLCGLHSPPAEMFSPHHATYRGAFERICCRAASASLAQHPHAKVRWKSSISPHKHQHCFCVLIKSGLV